MWGIDVIPSFGNVTNILLFVASAPTLVAGGVKRNSARHRTNLNARLTQPRS
jgi:hypothetical protein